MADQELSITITTDAELAAIQKARREYAAMLKEVDKNSKAAEDLTEALGKCDEALSSSTAKIVERRRELEKMMVIGAKAGVDASEQAQEYDRLGESLKEGGVSLDQVASSAQVLGTVMQASEKGTRLFGMSIRQLTTSFKAFGKFIPGLNILLRITGGGVMALMGAFMALGLVVTKVKKYFDDLEEQYKKFSEEAAKPMRKSAEANTKALQDQAAWTTNLDIALVKATSHQKTYADAAKDAAEKIHRESKAQQDMADAQKEMAMFGLEELKEKQLIGVEDYERRKAEIEAKARKEKIERELQADAVTNEFKLKQIKDWTKRGQQEAMAAAAGAAAKKFETAKALESMVSKETRERSVAQAKEEQEKAEKALKKEGEYAATGTFSPERYAKAKEAVDVAKEGVRKEEAYLAGFEGERKDKTEAAAWAAAGEAAATARLTSESGYMATSQRDVDKANEDRAFKKRQSAVAEAETAKMTGAKVAMADWRLRMRGESPQSKERTRRVKWVEKAAISEVKKQNFLRNLPMSPEDNDTLMTELVRARAVDEIDEPTFQAARVDLMKRRNPNYGGIYRDWDRKWAEGKGFASGGYTGDGPPGQVAGVVHKGEYVIPSHHLQQFGTLAMTGALQAGVVGGGLGRMAESSRASGLENLALVRKAMGKQAYFAAHGNKARTAMWTAARSGYAKAAFRQMGAAGTLGGVARVAGKAAGPLALIGTGAEAVDLARDFGGVTSRTALAVGSNPIKGAAMGLLNPVSTMATNLKTQYDIVSEVAGMVGGFDGRRTRRQQVAWARAQGPRGGIGTRDDQATWQVSPSEIGPKEAAMANELQYRAFSDRVDAEWAAGRRAKKTADVIRAATAPSWTGPFGSPQVSSWQPFSPRVPSGIAPRRMGASLRGVAALPPPPPEPMRITMPSSARPSAAVSDTTNLRATLESASSSMQVASSLLLRASIDMGNMADQNRNSGRYA